MVRTKKRITVPLNPPLVLAVEKFLREKYGKVRGNVSALVSRAVRETLDEVDKLLEMDLPPLMGKVDVCVTIDRDLYNRLNFLSKLYGVPRSELVRRCLALFFKRYGVM